MKNQTCVIAMAALLLGPAIAGADESKAPALDVAGALQRYVAAEDDSYKWVTRVEGELLGGQYAELTLTSQTWKGIVWRHRLFVFKPAAMRHPEQALMLIGGGSWKDRYAEPVGDNPPELPGAARMLATVATSLGSPMVVITHVPFQPIFDGKREDAIISYTFQQYMETEDQTWPCLLPMVKSAVRGMDAAQEYANEQWDLSIENFLVTGASKRGWTTWLTSAVDSRVNALAPMVIDVLNMTPQMQHQLDSWGEYSANIHDYTDRGLPDMLRSGEGESLLRIVDPYAYRAAVTQPKLIMLGTNDAFWPVDALNFYWDGLEGQKHILYVPNAGHGLNDMGRVLGSLAALHRSVVTDSALPKLTWRYTEYESGLRLEVQSDPKPTSVSVWMATSSKRDFRKASWRSVAMTPTEDGYRYELDEPTEGSAAFFGEAMYTNAAMPYYLSTTIKVCGPAAAPRPPLSGRPEGPPAP